MCLKKPGLGRLAGESLVTQSLQKAKHLKPILSIDLVVMLLLPVLRGLGVAQHMSKPVVVVDCSKLLALRCDAQFTVLGVRLIVRSVAVFVVGTKQKMNWFSGAQPCFHGPHLSLRAFYNKGLE